MVLRLIHSNGDRTQDCIIGSLDRHGILLQ